MIVKNDNIELPCVGRFSTGEYLYLQSNGRLSTERLFNNKGNDLLDFISIDIINGSYEIIPIKVSLVCPKGILFYVNTTNGIKMYKYGDKNINIISQSHRMPEDKLYGTEEGPDFLIEDVIVCRYNITKPNIYYNDGHLSLSGNFNNDEIKVILKQYNSLKYKVGGKYLLYAEINPKTKELIPTYVEKEVI